MNWHRWFAWYPVRLRNGHFVWLRFVDESGTPEMPRANHAGATGHAPPSTSDLAALTLARRSQGAALQLRWQGCGNDRKCREPDRRRSGFVPEYTRATRGARVRVVRHYRVFLIDQDAHIAEPPIEIDCENDGEAINTAKQLVDGRDIELWEESRFIASFSNKSLDATHSGS